MMTSSAHDASLDSQSIAASLCPECQADLPAESISCEECGAVVSLPSLEEPNPKQYSSSAFSLSSLLLLMTLSSFLLAMFSLSFWVGILAAGCFIPVSIRTLLIIRKHLRIGQKLSTPLRMEIFLQSLVITVLAWGSSILVMGFSGSLLELIFNFLLGTRSMGNLQLYTLVFAPAFLLGGLFFGYCFYISRSYYPHNLYEEARKNLSTEKLSPPFPSIDP